MPRRNLIIHSYTKFVTFSEQITVSGKCTFKAAYSRKIRNAGIKAWRTFRLYFYRLKSAGLHENIFTQAAIEAIYSASKGVPRLVNSLATSSLMYACLIKQKHIDEEIVYQGQKDFDI